MITCDYLIIGSGFAGIGLKYKLQGKTIMIDKNPFQYKIAGFSSFVFELTESR